MDKLKTLWLSKTWAVVLPDHIFRPKIRLILLVLRSDKIQFPSMPNISQITPNQSAFRICFSIPLMGFNGYFHLASSVGS